MLTCNFLYVGKIHTILCRRIEGIYVCSQHFTQNDYKQDMKIKMLLPTAVPTVFRSFPANKQQQFRKLNNKSIKDFVINDND